MHWNSVTKIRRLTTQLSIVNVGLLVLVTTIVFYLIVTFVYPINMLYQQSIRPIMNVMVDNNHLARMLRDNKNLEETIDILIQEEKLMQQKIDVCQNEKKDLTNLLEERKTNAQISEQQRDVKRTAFDEKLFNYMSTFLRDTPYPGVENYTRYTVARLGLSPLAGIEPLKPEDNGDAVYNDVTSFRYPIAIGACQNVTVSGRSVVVVVNSAPENFDRRNRIRQTWRNHLNAEYHKDLIDIVGFAFILALPDNNNVTQKQIEEESRTHGDIIQIEMPDIYRRLAVKVAALFNWLNTNCGSIDFILKVDDDVYVNVRNLAHLISEQHPSNQSIFGSYVGYGVDYLPNREGKFIITYEEWPWTRYPRYFNGPAVVITGSSIFPLLAAMQTTPIMPFDDVYYLGICTEKTDIRLHYSSESNSVFSMECADLSSPCDLHRFASWLTSSGDQMEKSHVAIEEFYHNETQCVIVGSNGTNTTINQYDPVHFKFDIYFHSSY